MVIPIYPLTLFMKGEGGVESILDDLKTVGKCLRDFL